MLHKRAESASSISKSWKLRSFNSKRSDRRRDFPIYYIDMSVLPKNRQLVFSIRNYIRDTSEIFSISSPVKISLTSFLCLSFVFRLVFFFNFWNTHIYVRKRKLHGGANIWSLSSRGKKISLVDKLHMFSPPFNILCLIILFNLSVYIIVMSVCYFLRITKKCCSWLFLLFFEISFWSGLVLWFWCFTIKPIRVVYCWIAFCVTNNGTAD